MSDFQCDQFDPSVETIDKFLQRLQCQMADSFRKARNDSVRQASILLKCLPTRIITDLQRRIAPKRLTDADYDELEEQLRQRYSDKKSTVGAAVQFFRYKQEPGQTIEEYAQQVNFLATQCQYNNDVPLDRLIRDVFISGLQSSAILSAVLQTTDTQSFEETVQRAKTAQQLKSDAISIQHGRSAAVLCIEGSDSSESSGDDTLNSLRSNPVPASYVCIRCGAKGKHFHNKCFALNLFCNKCGKKGHIAKMCKSSASATSSNSSRSSTVRQNRTCHATTEIAPDQMQRCHISPIPSGCCCQQHTVSSLRCGTPAQRAVVHQRPSPDASLKAAQRSNDVSHQHMSCDQANNFSENVNVDQYSFDDFLM